MRYVGTAFIAAVLLIVAWTMYLIQPQIPGMVQGAADLASLTVRACLGTGAVIVVAVVVWFMLRQQYERDRKRDGAFAVRWVHLQPLPMRVLFWFMGRTSPRVMVDMNASPTPYVGIDRNGLFQVEPSWGHDRQLAYVLDNNKTERVQAAIAGDAVLGNPLVNLQRGIGGVANAATGRWMAGAYDKPVKPSNFVDPLPPEPSRLPAPELTGVDAVEQSRPASIVMGQTDTGELVRWNMAQTPHLRFHGTTQGSGKTNAIQTVAAGALATGAHVVVCDRVQFKDWGDFEQCAELVDTSDPKQLAAACLRLYNVYLGRTHLLKKARAKNAEQHGDMQRIVMVISEFGAQMADARAAGVGRDVEYPLTQLARLAGSTGIHLIAEDQAVKRWPRELTSNMWPVIGKNPAYDGQACGYQGRGGGTDTFPSYTFWFEGTMFKTPHMEPDLPAIMAQVPPPQALVMLTPAAAIPGEDAERSAFGRSVEPQMGGDTPVFAPERTERTPERTKNTPVPNDFEEGPTDLQTAVWAWRDAHPEGTQADMRREFEARGIEIARGYAHELWHKWPGKQHANRIDLSTDEGRAAWAQYMAEARLTNGDKLGTDITGGAL